MKISKEYNLIRKAIISSGIFLIAIIAYLCFFSFDFPNITKSSTKLVLSFTLFCAFLLLSVKNAIIYNNITSLSYYFNSVWCFSLSLSLLSLSAVQNELSYPFILYVLMYLAMFNLGYAAFSKTRYKKSYLLLNTVNVQQDLRVFQKRRFKVLFSGVLFVCVLGYCYEMYSVGFIPIIQVITAGFYDNRAGFLSVIHYFVTSLGAIAGLSFGIWLVVGRRGKRKVYMCIFLVASVLAASVFAKNIMFMILFFFLSTWAYYRNISLNKLKYFLIIFVTLMMISAILRTGSNDYIKRYSQIGYQNMPSIMHWLNTYFAVNVSHWQTYFENGYTSTYGLNTIKSISSFLFVRTQLEHAIVGKEIVSYFNGLGGDINVIPLLTVYMFDFGILGPFALIFIGILAAFVNDGYNRKKGFAFVLLHAALSYAFVLSVFGDFLNRIMLHVAVLFLIIPFILSGKRRVFVGRND